MGSSMVFLIPITAHFYLAALPDAERHSSPKGDYCVAIRVIVSNDELLAGSCDVFTPCALSGVLNELSIPTFNTTVIAGVANNQLLTQKDDTRRANARILYCPDYLLNTGGVIALYQRRQGSTHENIHAGVAAIADRLKSVLTAVQSRSISPQQVAQERAGELIREQQNSPIPTLAAW